MIPMPHVPTMIPMTTAVPAMPRAAALIPMTTAALAVFRVVEPITMPHVREPTLVNALRDPQIGSLSHRRVLRSASSQPRPA
jgi:hypothetical protein